VLLGAERRAGRVPGIIYGDGKPPLPISLDYNELSQSIFAGHFLTTVHDVEIDGVKHRVIPRDFQLDAVRDYLQELASSFSKIANRQLRNTRDRTLDTVEGTRKSRRLFGCGVGSRLADRVSNPSWH
jgi:ribosomal protein L25 (general stress protein Ctc)